MVTIKRVYADKYTETASKYVFKNPSKCIKGIITWFSIEKE